MTPARDVSRCSMTKTQAASNPACPVCGHAHPLSSIDQRVFDHGVKISVTCPDCGTVFETAREGQAS